MWQAKGQEGKSQASTKVNVMEPIAKNINIDIEKQKQEISDSTINSDDELWDKETEFPPLDSVAQQMQPTKEEEQCNEELEIVSKPTNHLMEPIVPEQAIKPSEAQSTDQEITKEDTFVEVPHIDYVFRDQQWELDDCIQLRQILKLLYQRVQSCIKTQFSHQKKLCVKPPLNWKKRSYEASKPSKENQIN